VTVHGSTVRSLLTGCEVTTRPRDRFSSYSKWLDTFLTALIFVCRYRKLLNQTVLWSCLTSATKSSNLICCASVKVTPVSNVLLEKLAFPYLVKNSPRLWNHNIYYCYEECQPLVHIRSQMSIVRHPHNIYFLILTDHLRLCRSSGLFPSDLLTKTLYAFLLCIFPHTCHIPLPISSIFVFPPEQNPLWNTNHEAGHFSSVLYFFSTAPQNISQMPSVCFLFLTWKTKFSTHNTYTHILICIICRCSSFWLDIGTGNRDAKDSHSIFRWFIPVVCGHSITIDKLGESKHNKTLLTI
jgi:hypothetical protein